jgi:hypothetical protein
LIPTARLANAIHTLAYKYIHTQQATIHQWPVYIPAIGRETSLIVDRYIPAIRESSLIVGQYILAIGQGELPD